MASLKDLVSIAEQYVGVPYVYGGKTPKGFDCSGLMQYVYKKVGIKIPRTSQDQAHAGIAIKEADLSPGDLILSDWGEGANSHVAMYVGKGKLIEAPRTGLDVRIADLNANYRAHVDGYRRVSSKKKGILDSIEGIASGAWSDVNAIGKAIGDANSSLLGGIGSAAGGLISWPGDIVDFFSTATSSLGSTVDFFTAFFRPSTYVRIGAGAMGVTFVIAGIVFLLMEAAQ